MKVGLIARCDDRGLGRMTWDFHRHMKPARTLVVDMGPLARGFTQHQDRYPDGLVVPFDGVQLPSGAVYEWLRGLDVIYTAETFYDDRLPGWAADEGVATVLHAMPEFYRPGTPATQVWVPTTWRLDTMPAGTLVVPVPVTSPDWPPPTRRTTGQPLRVLHVAGNRAAGDRNGTSVLAAALGLVRQPMQVTVTTQGARLPSIHPARQCRLERRMGNQADHWDLYRDQDVMVLPRRYGGLCLPAQEALAAGLGVVMPTCPPNRETWPVFTTLASEGRPLMCPTGPVPMWQPDPRGVAQALDLLAKDVKVLADLQREGRAWATDHSWGVMAGLYRELLADAAGMKREASGKNPATRGAS